MTMKTAPATTATNATSRVTTRAGTDTSHHLASTRAHRRTQLGRPRLSQDPGRRLVTRLILRASVPADNTAATQSRNCHDHGILAATGIRYALFLIAARHQSVT